MQFLLISPRTEVISTFIFPVKCSYQKTMLSQLMDSSSNYAALLCSRGDGSEGGGRAGGPTTEDRGAGGVRVHSWRRFGADHAS